MADEFYVKCSKGDVRAIRAGYKISNSYVPLEVCTTCDCFGLRLASRSRWDQIVCKDIYQEGSRFHIVVPASKLKILSPPQLPAPSSGDLSQRVIRETTNATAQVICQSGTNQLLFGEEFAEETLRLLDAIHTGKFIPPDIRRR